MKWFLAIYLMVCDKGGLSALRLSKRIGVSWITAHRMPRKMRPGSKSGRGAEGKASILMAVESRGPKAGFIAMETTSSVSAETIRHFARHRLLPRQSTRTDGLVALRVPGGTQQHEGRETRPQQVDEWLPWVHIAIGNLKASLLGTFHAVSAQYLQAYLDEFAYRLNGRFWLPELPSRLLNACMDHTPLRQVAEKG